MVRMSPNLLQNATIAGMMSALFLASCVPTAIADTFGLARTTTGGCVEVNWSTNPYYVVAPATGCTSLDPCVSVDPNTSPPTAVPSNNC
ncbi:MAG: hypothetical protein QOE90_1008 [Thermoplasmata archaeon]|nr:hypothetical protein [Thermoplasmata archaeon]